jgi:D-sedoheptulose 7-phosphate isomerase
MADELVRRRFGEALAVKQALLDGDEHVRFAVEAAGAIVASLRAGGKVLFCGNGGSAADGMHLAAELVGRFRLERDALPAIALSDSQSLLTCVGNDYAFERVFARGVEALGRPGDVLVAISTSGTSPNVLAAVEAARERGLRVLGMTGAAGGRLAELSDACLRVPSEETARVQEGYMLVGHTVCELVEAELFGA